MTYSLVNWWELAASMIQHLSYDTATCVVVRKPFKHYWDLIRLIPELGQEPSGRAVFADCLFVHFTTNSDGQEFAAKVRSTLHIANDYVAVFVDGRREGDDGTA